MASGGVAVDESAACFVCSAGFPDKSRLKSHLLLKHPELNLCLFCVEDKGWSDTFSTQASYNEHASGRHRHRLSKGRRPASAKEEPKVRTEGGGPPKKRPCRRLICRICQIEFSDGSEYDRHLVAQHGFDFCPVCRLIGPRVAVRLHICQEHAGDDGHGILCPLCCSKSPVMSGGSSSLTSHVKSRHAVGHSTTGSDAGSPFPCHDCPAASGFATLQSYALHLQAHLDDLCSTTTSAPGSFVQKLLRPMRRGQRRVKANQVGAGSAGSAVRPDDDEDEQKLRTLHSNKIRNPSGQHCYAAAVLHLLGQLDLVASTRNDDGGVCSDSRIPGGSCCCPRCTLLEFLSAYRCRRSRHRGRRAGDGPTSSTTTTTYSSLSPEVILERLEVEGSSVADCGLFLRTCLEALDEGCSSDEASSPASWPSFEHHIEWKFECDSCHRYTVTSLKDSVVRIPTPQSTLYFEELLDRFLHRKTCGGCQAICSVQPVLKDQAGRPSNPYVFFEVDRSTVVDDHGVSKELSLFSLGLQLGSGHYTLWGDSYSLLGTINYNLAMEQGGHYLTVIPSPVEANNRLVFLHETEMKTLRRKPDFDEDAFIVALQRVDGDRSCDS